MIARKMKEEQVIQQHDCPWPDAHESEKELGSVLAKVELVNETCLEDSQTSRVSHVSTVTKLSGRIEKMPMAIGNQVS